MLNPAPLHKVDILFMVDNSASMLTLQTKALASFPAFASVLKALPGGLPDLHIAVISSDTGPGKLDLPAYHCSFAGDRGLFQSAPRAPCTTAPLPVGQTFLQATNDQQTKNYTGDISDAFACIAALGQEGCGFEGQRLSQWAASFGASGSVESLCADSLDPAMQRLGTRVGGLFRPSCADGSVPTAANGQPACRVIDQTAGPGSTLAPALLPNCSDDNNVAPCWTATADSANCGTGKRITVNRGPSLPPGYVDTAFSCDACAAGSTEIGCH